MTTPAVVVEKDLEQQKNRGDARRRPRPGTTVARSSAGWFTYVALAVVVFLWVVPTLGILLTSFRSRDDSR